ncbi:Bifunctional DNA primase/polymerase, N-terminal [Actinopolyspora xinjiangensis]|uniref:Bifunctional DNA primase/polymerase, N-terminal n=1 Tax=Actinopolyspora xinjiangensis TaxID=405564 RepID=A0A1H0NP12_9ACTN|nr:bifunctional DNA primase/polymerase [Actinopolyspora xinjiangensis]SDO94409.1 Bifunctional DNA primase/polymerase, N-terminal [Actinopolyspora xinjiangensis]
MSSPYQVACWLAWHGFAVFPLRPHSKRPFGNCRACGHGRCTTPHECPCLTKARPCHGLLAATTDLGQLARWWRHTPRANVGIHTGRSGLVVLDLDRKPEPPAPAAPDIPTPVTDGLHALDALTAAEQVTWPDTLTVKTPSQGRHLYFRCPEGLSVSSDATGRVGHQIDLRADGGYVVAPGCAIHAPPEDRDGTYQRCSPTTGIAELPDWLRHRVLPPAPAPAEPAPRQAPNLGAGRSGQHTAAYWRRIWHDELDKVETRPGERWRLLYAAARRLANLATHDHAPWSETETTDALLAAALRRRQRTGKPTEESTARRNIARGWLRGTHDTPDSLHGLGRTRPTGRAETPAAPSRADTGPLSQQPNRGSGPPRASTTDTSDGTGASAHPPNTPATGHHQEAA